MRSVWWSRSSAGDRRIASAKLLMAHTAKIAPLDSKTFTLELAERFGPVLDALGKPSNDWIGADQVAALVHYSGARTA
jgi:hypothetical protein